MNVFVLYDIIDFQSAIIVICVRMAKLVVRCNTRDKSDCSFKCGPKKNENTDIPGSHKFKMPILVSIHQGVHVLLE